MSAAPADPAVLFRHLRPGTHAALAVSGGSDSMALLRLAAAGLATPGTPVRFSVLTVDHGLRPEAAAEAAQVGAWCAALGLAHATLRWTGPKPATGLQARARAARYGLLTGWCRVFGADILLTAHTLDDQAETVLMRMARTASLDSLAGIPRHGSWQGVPLFRPLLGLRRAALQAYLRGLGQAWIEDPGNSDPRFERVRVRQALAALGSVGMAPERLAALAEQCAAAVAAWEDSAERFLAAIQADCRHGYVRLARTALRDVPREVQIRILGRLIARIGGSGRRPDRADLLRLADWLDGGSTGRTLGGAVIRRKADSFLIAREAGRIGARPVVVPETGRVLWDNRAVVEAPPGSEVFAAALAPGHRSAAAVPEVVRRSEPAVRLPDGTIVAVSYGVPGPARVDFRGAADP